MGKGKARRGWAEEGGPMGKALTLGRSESCVTLGESFHLSEQGFFICRKGCFSVISVCVGDMR